MKNVLRKHGGKLLLTIFALYLAVSYYMVDSYRVKITGKVPKDNVYLVYTDLTTFKVIDDWKFGLFTSSDRFGKLEVNETYDIKASGFRLGFMSIYENIISFEKVSK